MHSGMRLFRQRRFFPVCCGLCFFVCFFVCLFVQSPFIVVQILRQVVWTSFLPRSDLFDVIPHPEVPFLSRSRAEFCSNDDRDHLLRGKSNKAGTEKFRGNYRSVKVDYLCAGYTTRLRGTEEDQR